MPTNYPAALDSFTTKVDGVDDVLAADINKLQDATLAMQVQVGVNGSPTSFASRLNSLESRQLPIGQGQTWQGVSRSSGTLYQNTTGRTIFVAISATGTNNAFWAGTSPSSLMRLALNNAGGSGPYEQYHIAVPIPAGWYYRVDGSFSEFAELR